MTGIVVASHKLSLLDGEITTFVTDRAALAVFGNLTLPELTLQLQLRCPLSLDALNVGLCDCADRLDRLHDRLRGAPLGALAYLPNDDVETAYEHLGALLGRLPTVERIFLLNRNLLEEQVLRDAGYDVIHQPTVFPVDNPRWPRRSTTPWGVVRARRFVRRLQDALLPS